MHKKQLVCTIGKNAEVLSSMYNIIVYVSFAWFSRMHLVLSLSHSLSLHHLYITFLYIRTYVLVSCAVQTVQLCNFCMFMCKYSLYSFIIIE